MRKQYETIKRICFTDVILALYDLDGHLSYSAGEMTHGEGEDGWRRRKGRTGRTFLSWSRSRSTTLRSPLPVCCHSEVEIRMKLLSTHLHQ
jgi:hypothetical protein